MNAAFPTNVIPAKAGIASISAGHSWMAIPAFAGMTGEEEAARAR